jgi:hypothetical protein
MWHSFLTQPLVIRVLAWVALGVAALIALIKAKAIHAACSAAWSAVSSRFWKAVANKVSVNPTDERTYKGTFEGCETPPRVFFHRG